MDIDNKGNKIVGNYPKICNSTINFNGKNNILYCAENLDLNGTYIEFRGNNAVAFINASYIHKGNILLNNNCTVYIGKMTFLFGISIQTVNDKHCFIGDDCLFASGVKIRNTDSHCIYDCFTYERLNQCESIYIGDHVWLAEDVLILKGTQIDSGCVIGARSVVANKKIPHNTIWAGNPVRKIKENIFWDKQGTHKFTAQMEKDSLYYPDYISNHHKDFALDHWKYEYNKDEETAWEYLEENFAKMGNEDKLEFFVRLDNKKTKNRFVHLY